MTGDKTSIRAQAEPELTAPRARVGADPEAHPGGKGDDFDDR
jgi:hypothetical protein